MSARSRARADAPDWIPYYAELLQRLRDTAGVRSARLSYKPPISNEQGYWFGHVAADGAPAPPWRERTYLNAISPGYVALSVPPSLPGVISRRAIAMAAHVSRSSMLRWRGRSSATSRRSGVIS